MSCSDNVVRAGLTEKFRDVKVLCDMLSYETGNLASSVRKTSKLHSYFLQIPQVVVPMTDVTQPGVLIYNSPVDEFQVAKLQIDGSNQGKFSALDAPSVLLVTSGSGQATTQTVSGWCPVQVAS